ncbi:MAG: hypothetical protein HUJ31_06975 [Pseudomonadales bacterium]|nr:hypothetical protein [Pseudomonadales bacterium]
MEESERQQYLQIVTRKLVGLTATCVFILVIVFYVIELSDLNRTYLVAYVFLGGLIGGFVSIQQRLPNIGLSELRELSGSWLSILLIPINGGIFALVLMLIFLSGILEGAMFPTYHHESIDQSDLVASFVNWLSNTFPASGPDVAKLLFWSFVAGFSERFVPQIIRKTVDKVE